MIVKCLTTVIFTHLDLLESDLTLMLETMVSLLVMSFLTSDRRELLVTLLLIDLVIDLAAPLPLVCVCPLPM